MRTRAVVPNTKYVNVVKEHEKEEEEEEEEGEERERERRVSETWIEQSVDFSKRKDNARIYNIVIIII